MKKTTDLISYWNGHKQDRTKDKFFLNKPLFLLVLCIKFPKRMFPFNRWQFYSDRAPRKSIWHAIKEKKQQHKNSYFTFLTSAPWNESLFNLN